MPDHRQHGSRDFVFIDGLVYHLVGIDKFSRVHPYFVGTGALQRLCLQL